MTEIYICICIDHAPACKNNVMLQYCSLLAVSPKSTHLIPHDANVGQLSNCLSSLADLHTKIKKLCRKISTFCVPHKKKALFILEQNSYMTSQLSEYNATKKASESI